MSWRKIIAAVTVVSVFGSILAVVKVVLELFPAH